MLTFLTSCPHEKAEDIEKMTNTSTQISYDQFIEKVSEKELDDQFSFPTLRFKDDYHVSYYRSTFKGIACYYLDHSRIEYIWI